MSELGVGVLIGVLGESGLCLLLLTLLVLPEQLRAARRRRREGRA